jgi:hypothetical protein
MIANSALRSKRYGSSSFSVVWTTLLVATAALQCASAARSYPCHLVMPAPTAGGAYIGVIRVQVVAGTAVANPERALPPGAVVKMFVRGNVEVPCVKVPTDTRFFVLDTTHPKIPDAFHQIYATVTYQGVTVRTNVCNFDVENGPIRRYVSHVYRTVLGRWPNNPGLEAWSRQLAQKKATPPQVVNIFLHGGEGNTDANGGWLMLTYRLCHWFHLPKTNRAFVNDIANELKAGGSLQIGEADCCASDMYWQLVAKSTVPGYIDAICRDLIGHVADPTTRAIWIQRVASGNYSPRTAAHAFARSPQGAARLITRLWVTYLGRGPNAAELAFHVEHLKTVPAIAYIPGLLGSNEAFARFFR